VPNVTNRKSIEATFLCRQLPINMWSKGTQRLLARLPAKQLYEIPGALVWRQERDDDLP
jgi:hypothetical protein